MSRTHWHTNHEHSALYYWFHPTDLSYLSDVSTADYHTFTGYVFSPEPQRTVFSYYEVKRTSCGRRGGVEGTSDKNSFNVQNITNIRTAIHCIF